ncbi:penicillin-binding protein activator [Aliiglaciecola sp. LCG003]|uniref:penicillin-binding protein activator n=1 Tax=Aliiglaciecola sp. LCG003 TaxID=3053655 RepID=UPI00257373B0|nr:penicillin-binding protein activator [Aliiglaciecola sp. LCG003]WJG08698.1 penicillin-binding protein activator [Aliiglaciecola sp. LCG003]
MHKLKWSVICLSSILIVGCGSTPKKTSQEVVIDNQPSQTDNLQPESINDPDYYLQQAELADRNEGDKHRRNQYILQAAEAYQQLGACQQTTKIVQLAEPQIQDVELHNLAYVLLAECLLEAPKVDYKTLGIYLPQINPELGQTQRVIDIQSRYYIHTKQWLSAAKSKVRYFNNTPEDSETIWYLLQNLSEAELETARLRAPELTPWVQLSLIVQRYGLQADKLQIAVQEWQQRFAGHPLSEHLPEEISVAMQTLALKQQKIAVLLPLSGRFVQQGLAIKEGVIAAYLAQTKQLEMNADVPYPAVRFFDSQSIEINELVAQTADFDVVIGPLMKDKLSEFSALADKGLNIVGLNRLDIEDTPPVELSSALPSSSELLPNPPQPIKPGLRVYFALSPEDEAVQIALKVFNSGARHPIVISQENGAGRRMADTFLQSWLSLSSDNSPANLATFNDNKSMRTSLTGLLDVAQSKDRIDQIEGLTSHQIYAVPRNRRDVDAIILFSTPEQTELLNPIVEASLSPFNDKSVPVYASSRSFSQNFSNNSLRDLRNMIFSDMPWMLPSNNNLALHQEVEQIWPQRDDTLKRLFALGYDSLNILPELAALSVLPQVSQKGLTGSLSVDSKGNILRQLPFGKITENEVILLAMD